MDRVRVNEGESEPVTFILRDTATSLPVPLADIDSATLTLYDLETYDRDASPVAGIINGRDGQDVLTDPTIVIHATSGLVTWTMQPDDNPVFTRRRQIERHRAVFHFDVGGLVENYQIEVEVVRILSQG